MCQYNTVVTSDDERFHLE